MARPALVGLALAAAAALALVPCAGAANVMDMSFAPDFKQFTMSTTGDLDGAASSQLREAADQYGNKDGAATQAEGDKMLHDFKSMVEGSMTGSVSDGNMTLDGRLPTSVEVTTLSATGFAGAVASTDPITMTAEMVVHTNPMAADTHTLFVRGHSESGSDTSQIAIHAPAGFYIQSASGVPGGAAYDTGHTTLRFTDTAANGSDGTIVFAKGSLPGNSSPAMGPAVLLLLAALAFLRRRA